MLLEINWGVPAIVGTAIGCLLVACGFIIGLMFLLGYVTFRNSFARPKAKTPVRVTVALVQSPAGLLLQRRPGKGLLAGLWQPAAWEKELTQPELAEELAKIGVEVTWGEALPAARHSPPWTGRQSNWESAGADR